jgi:hypothetical protein
MKEAQSAGSHACRADRIAGVEALAVADADVSEVAEEGDPESVTAASGVPQHDRWICVFIGADVLDPAIRRSANAKAVERSQPARRIDAADHIDAFVVLPPERLASHPVSFLPAESTANMCDDCSGA